MKSNTCIGRFIDLYFDHKEICIKEENNESYFDQQ